MRSHGNQLDIFDHDPARLARAYRIAAGIALIDPHFPSSAERAERHQHYVREANRYERLTTAKPRSQP